MIPQSRGCRKVTQPGLLSNRDPTKSHDRSRREACKLELANIIDRKTCNDTNEWE